MLQDNSLIYADGDDDRNVLEISRLRDYSDQLERELSQLELSVLTSPRVIVKADNDDSDDDIHIESTIIYEDDKIDSLYHDINDAAVLSAMTPRASHMHASDDDDHGFTPMSLSKFFDHHHSDGSYTPESSVDVFLNVLMEARTRIAPVSAHKPARKAKPSPSSSQHRVTPRHTDSFFLSAFDEDDVDELDFDGDVDIDGDGIMPMIAELQQISQLIPQTTNSDDVVSAESLKRTLEMDDNASVESDIDVNVMADIDMQYFQQYKHELTSSTVSPTISSSKHSTASAWNKEVLIEAGIQAAREHHLQQSSTNHDHPLLHDNSNNNHHREVEDDLSPAARNHDPVFDERLRADFNVWTSGAKLSYPCLKLHYIGLFDSMLNHISSSSSLQCVSAIECVLRPDIELKRIMAAVLRASHTLQCKFQLVKRSHAIVSCNQPDPNHSIASSFTSISSPSHNNMRAPPSYDWDVMEVQVCISRELKQRVLVGTFLKRTSSSNLSISSTSKLTSSTTTVPISMRKMMNMLRRMLVSSKLCLSSLYRAPPITVCDHHRLDGHFVAQVQSLFRESMWSNLHAAFLTMDEYIKQEERNEGVMRQCMETIYKQHNITLSSSPKAGESLPLHRNVDHRVTSDDALLSAKGEAMMKQEEIEAEDTAATVSERSVGEYADGMAKCLHVVNMHFDKLQARFDSEFIVRLQRKHDVSFRLIDEMLLYRQSLLTAIAKNNLTQTSALNKAYKLAMAGVVPTTSFIPLTSTSSANHTIETRKKSSNDAAVVTLKNNDVISAASKDVVTPRSWLSSFMSFPSPATTTPSSSSISNAKVHVSKLDDLASKKQVNDAVATTTTSNIIDTTKSDHVSSTRRSFFSSENDILSLSSRNITTSSNDSNIGNSNSVDNNIISPSFMPTSAKAKLTAEKIKDRLDAYRHNIDPNPNPNNRPITPKPSSSMINCSSKEKLYDVVIYYCSCLVAKMPGTMYVTPYYLAFTSGWALAQYREMIPLYEVELVSIPPPAQASSYLQLSLPSNTIKLLMFGGKKEILMTPLAIDAAKVRLVIMDAIAAFPKR